VSVYTDTRDYLINNKRHGT